MKLTAGKINKERRQQVATSGRRCCGTLNYIAECRGKLKKAASSWKQTPAAGDNKLERRYPAMQ